MATALQADGIGVVASFCLAGGVLSGKYRSEGATGRAAETLDQPRVSPAVRAAEELAAMAAGLGTTAAALALAFPLASPAVASVLFGATSPEQMRENCAATSLLGQLDAADLARLRGIGLSSAP
jgi:aryl-alcohol dehydrogenase-like predicted oxidoreductase